jgi:hypothetical protein
MSLNNNLRKVFENKKVISWVSNLGTKSAAAA